MKLILDTLLKHAEIAARIAVGINDVTVGPLAGAFDLIVREPHGLAKLLASPERTALVDVLAYASSAARLVGHLDEAIAVGPLADHVDEVVHLLSELLGDRHSCGGDDDEPTEVRPCPALPPRTQLAEDAQ